MPPKAKAIIPEKALIAFIEQVKKPFPSSEILSGLAIEGLLTRIKRTNPQESTYLRLWVQILAWIEREDLWRIINEDSPRAHDMTKILANLMSIAIGELKAGKPDRFSHMKVTLQLQQSLLVHLMKLSPFPATVAGREKWLQQHREDMFTVLSSFKCYCCYPQSLNGIRADDYQWSRTPSDFFCLILAELHRTTPAQIRKLLSHRWSR